MSGLDILGGIGAGIMKGQEMVQRNQTHAQKLKEGELNMDAQRQSMEFQAREKARQEAEREREARSTPPTRTSIPARTWTTTKNTPNLPEQHSP